ncbi:hypothetical protein DJ71_24375, partial [Halorubrum sp. E3]
MNRTAVVVLVLFAILGGLAAGTAISDDPIEQAPAINDTTTTDTAKSQTAAASQQYTVVAVNESSINKTQLARYGTVGTQAGAKIELTMQSANVTAVEDITWVRNVHRAIQSRAADIPGSSNGSSLGVEELHQKGTTGAGVEVGIIDSGFDADNQQIAPNVVDTASFRDTAGDQAHGTSVAEIVTRTAPESQLYLVSTATGTDVEAAIDYLTDQDVDIIVFAAGFPAVEDTGDHYLTDDITAARDNGTLFVNSAGNEAQTHWEGRFRNTDGDRFHEWASDGDEVNSIPGPARTHSGTIGVYIRWSDTGGESTYRPAFYDPEAEEYIRIDRDGVFNTGSNKYTELSVRVNDRPVGLVIENSRGPADDDIEIAFRTGPQSIEHNIPESSVLVPADVPETMSVAAYEVGPQRIAPYSSQGPTDDGRQAIDVTGYTNIHVTNGLYQRDRFVFSGTSASAPYVGGVAALVEQRTAGDASPDDVEAVLETSSDDILAPGADTVSGTGVVNATAAVETATPNVTVTELSVSPNTVTTNTTVNHHLEYTVTGASNDSDPDTHTVTLPPNAGFDNTGTSLAVTDADGTEIQLE